MPASRALVTPTERLLALRRADLFRELATPDLDVLSSVLREAVFRKGEVIQRADRPPTALHLVVEGTIEILRDDVRSQRLHAPFALGALDLFAGLGGGMRATALTEVVALRAPTEVMLELIEDHFTILHHILRVSARLLVTSLPRFAADRVVPANRDLPPCRVRERPLNLVERIVFLRRMPMFGQASLDSVAALAAHFREVRHPAGVELWHEGGRAEDILCLVDGAVRGGSRSSPGTVRYEPYAMLGGLAAMAEAPHYQRCVTETPIVGLLVEPNRLIDLIEDDFEMALSMVGGLARETLDVERQLHEQREPQKTPMSAAPIPAGTSETEAPSPSPSSPSNR